MLNIATQRWLLASGLPKHSQPRPYSSAHRYPWNQISTWPSERGTQREGDDGPKVWAEATADVFDNRDTTETRLSPLWGRMQKKKRRQRKDLQITGSHEHQKMVSGFPRYTAGLSFKRRRYQFMHTIPTSSRKMVQLVLPYDASIAGVLLQTEVDQSFRATQNQRVISLS